ncbi:uncharacterized protein At3g28850-like [Typha latifolia]|uniref:uncharacterized protein At3g28850-like n=1 Tax=Typha latifolia TaxID=4733 RepID=UPI003C30696C
MGCISSRLLPATRVYQSITSTNCPNHVVSLTSTTYGQLNLYPRHENGKQEEEEEEEVGEVIRQEETPEVINSWELMHDLDDETPKSETMKHRREFSRKGNGPPEECFGNPDAIPLQVLEPLASSESKQSFSPLFDPELIAFFDGELFEEHEQIKQVVSEVNKNLKVCHMGSLLQSFNEKWPPGGQNKVVLYTTSIRGIRKTFEDCNAVRSVFESYNVRVAERDISIDSGFREELRMLTGKNDVRAPAAFVKGRLIGGAEEVLRLEAEGKLGLLLEGLPAAAKWCGFCGGVKFLMCSSCNGSRKVIIEKKRIQRCGDCNENGLVHCHKCC